MSSTPSRALALGIAGAVVAAAPAEAAPRTLTASDASARACHVQLTPGAKGVTATRHTARATGLVQARLSGKGDWDVGVFDARSRRSIAGSAGPRTNELAEGFVRKGQQLIVQACRFRGDARTARLRTTVASTATRSSGTVKVVDVATPDAAAKRRLQGLDLDLTEHGDADSIEVVTHGRADEDRLRAAGFRYDVRIPDLKARALANQRADRAFAAEVAASALPSGRDSYRRLADFELELKQLSQRYPSLTRLVTLPYKTVLGRDVLALEIAVDPRNVEDGKPIFMNMGAHHAREWPSAEHAMEWAYDLLTNYGTSERTTRLVGATRTIVVPIVNPDGYTITREAASLPIEQRFSRFDYEYKRKNCSISRQATAAERTGTCEDNPQGRLRGTDLNRNYGGFWGGPGASPDHESDLFRGDAPFSEPETQNIKLLVGTRQVTALITNHTYGNLLLRPPGVAAAGFPIDEPLMRELGARMNAKNRYANIPSFGLYDTTGGTEDWTYWTAGALGYTFEIGPDEFHPPFESGVVAEYLGLAPADSAGRGGNREAYYEALEAVTRQETHGTLTGEAPAGSRLFISKAFRTSTSPVIQLDGTTGEPLQFRDGLASSYLVGADGRIDWAVNPSTRPIVAGRYGREPQGAPQAPITLANPEGIPAANPAGNPLTGAFETATFTVEGPPAADNGAMDVRIDWTDPNVDWDIYVLGPDGTRVGSAATFGTPFETARIFEPAPGEYRVVVVNYDLGATSDWTRGSVTFSSPTPATSGRQERWTLSCQRSGRVVTERSVYVERGERVDVGQVCRPKG